MSCAAAGIAVLLAITSPALRAAPAYETIQVVGPPAPANTLVQANNMNDDGAVPFAWFDESRGAWAVGAWLPRPMYGRPAGWSEHYTVATGGVPGGARPIWPFIDPAGVVTYVGTGFPGGAEGIVVNGAPVNIPWTRDCTNGFLCGRSHGPTAGLLGAASSAAASFAHWEARQSERENLFAPYQLVHAAAFALDGGLQQLGMPGGYDYANVAIATRTGHRVWTGFNQEGDPAQGTARLETFNYVESSAGSFDVGGGVQWITGRGDVVYTATASGQSAGTGIALLVRLAGPLGALGPGIHVQSSLPGMPSGHHIAAMNGAGVILAARNTPLLRYRVLNGGKSAPLSSLTTLPEPGNGSYGFSGLNETGMLLLRPLNTVGGQLVSLGTHLLLPTLDCSVTLNGAQPYRIGEEFDLDVTVRNVAGAAVTNVRLEGDMPGSSGLTVASSAFTPPAFDILSGPSPATPLSLAPGAEQVIRYRCRAARSGVGEVTAKVKATAASGNALRCEDAARLEIEVRGDLLVKLIEEPAGAFALDNVYQRTAPSGAQDRRVEILSEGQQRVFEVKVQNDEPRALSFRVFSLETGSTAIPARYLFGTNDITDAIKNTGWTTPELAANASVIFRVEFGPTDGALGGETRAARLTLSPVDSSAPCDLVRVEAVNAPPVEVTLRRGSATGLHPQSILAGQGDINAPLLFKTDPAALRLEPALRRGFVADGVTPLLVELRVPPENLTGLPQGIEYDFALEIAEGGTLNGTPAAQRLRVLQDGQWQSLGRLRFTETENVHFAQITPAQADDLRLADGATEMKLRLRFTQPGSGELVTDKVILLRRPPVVLVHGYNTGGDWGADFVQELRGSRAGEFIRVIRYGQDPAGAGDTEKLNTVLPFGQLARMLELEIRVALIDLAEAGWAFTRIDYIGHSQGGVLGRMLCSKNGNTFLPLPFRNVENHYRGRFHRVVTVGSPHNGTRLVSYMKRLKDRLAPGSARSEVGIAGSVAKLMISSGTSQPKFDPFGPDIRLLHSPDPSAPWHPDPGAMFHLVQTTVNHGSAPSFGNATPAEIALGLDSPNGALVIPRGSDGVVDFDSMTATTPDAGQSPPPNSYRMPSALSISHAFVAPAGINIFGGDQGQTDSIWVARHVVGALDQSDTVNPQDRVFGPFRLAVPLPPSVAASLDAAAARVTPGLAEAIGFAGGGGLQAAGGGVQSHLIELYPPPGETLARPVTWTVERYGENGVTSDGASLVPAGDPGRIWVFVDTAVFGDVVIYGTAHMTSGRVIMGAPFLVTSVEPPEPEWLLDGIEVRPDDGTYAVGTGIEPELWASYYSENEGSLLLQRWIRPEEFSATSSASFVVDVSNPVAWQMGPAPGGATVDVNWRGQFTSASFNVFPETASGVDDDGDGLANIDEADVPNRNGGPGIGDGNGDGAPDSSQNPVASLRAPNGQWLTLQASSAAGLYSTGLAPAPSDPGALPGRPVFDYGFLTLSQYLSAPGASAVFTLHLPANHDITTVWAYGPTPGNPAPHWFEFLSDGQTGAEVLTNRIILRFTDGSRGDGDGAADANLGGVLLGLARSLPAPPALRITLDPPGRHTIAWPAQFPNAARTYLEATDALSDSAEWRFVPQISRQTGGDNRLTITNDGPGLFYRLRGL